MMRPVSKEKSSFPQSDDRPPAEGTQARPRPLFTQIIHGAILCELVVWDDEQWSALTAAERPELARHFPGLGWVCAIPVLNLN